MVKIILIVVTVCVLAVALSIYMFVGTEIYVTRHPLDRSLSEDYYFHPKTKAIYYSPMGNWFELDFKPVPGATPDTFRLLSANAGILDGTKIVLYGDILPDSPSIDILTLKALDKNGDRFADKNGVYQPTQYPSRLQPVENAKPAGP